MNEIILETNGSSITINLIWLRDNCRCDECYNWSTRQKRKGHINIDTSSIKIKRCTTQDNNIRIVWDDDHTSEYELDWIESKLRQEIRPAPFLWTTDDIANKLPRIKSKDDKLTDDDEKILIQTLLEMGVAIVDNVTPTMKATEKIITHIGPVMETLYGGMWEIDLEDITKFKDTAYTTEPLMCHTDNTYFIEPAGLEIFHCLKPAETGGKTILLDGFKAAELLKKDNHEFYECLETTSLEWQYISNDYHHACVSTTLRTRELTNELEQVRFNMYDCSARLPFTRNVDLFYSSLHKFRNILNDTSLQWKIQLQPGTVLFVNNWRVMHGRSRFTGRRTIAGCYQAMGTLLSKARKLRIIK